MTSPDSTGQFYTKSRTITGYTLIGCNKEFTVASPIKYSGCKNWTNASREASGSSYRGVRNVGDRTHYPKAAVSRITKPRVWQSLWGQDLKPLTNTWHQEKRDRTTIDYMKPRDIWTTFNVWFIFKSWFEQTNYKKMFFRKLGKNTLKYCLPLPTSLYFLTVSLR